MNRTSVGYARVSTAGQGLTAQREGVVALEVGPKLIYVDHCLTGLNRERPGLLRLLPPSDKATRPW